MTTLTISGCPLEADLEMQNVQTDEYNPGHWLLNATQVEQVMIAWRDADTSGEHTDQCNCDESDIARAFHCVDLGTFVTALHMDHELVMDDWETQSGYDDDAVYSTADMPFDFTITVA